MKREKNIPLTETTFYILLSLLEPGHGYAIMQKVEELSKGEVKIAAGTMYGAIENLMKSKYIKQVPSNDNRRKVYLITEEGRRILKLDLERIEHMTRIAKTALK